MDFIIPISVDFVASKIDLRDTPAKRNAIVPSLKFFHAMLLAR